MLYLDMKMKFSPHTIRKLKEYKTGIVYLFGSRVQKNKSIMSDFDIGIVFNDIRQLKNITEIHPHLYNHLTEEFPATFKNEIDIVYLQETSPHFQYEAITKGKVIFEHDPIFRANYEERVTKEYLDFKPIEKIFSKALLERQ